MKAYDLHLRTHAVDRASPANHGWCFGLPPGIRPEQWPLDPTTGHPLMHGFTLLLPDDYRVHGPEIVALSFFAIALDHTEAPEGPDGLEDAALGQGTEPPDDPVLRPLWQHGREPHPRLHRMEDELGWPYAVILLTREAFDGPLCEPPVLPVSGLPAPPPAWRTVGAASAFWKQAYSPYLSLQPEEYAVFKQLGGVPDEDPHYHRALHWTPRVNDPNAGKAPATEGDDGGYASPYGWNDDRTEFVQREWSLDHQPNHIGGTMRPCQGTPPFSAFHIGFEEVLGGYNFGSGCAQLDIRDMKIDWAC